ncbi:tryptophan--tRNA ligase [Helicobacter monodelphidis]|uniref:tryptophan--tRNA ligase n=1 Tax=Helicobacter sp. 15-1451 TaxID=2004995 RepID=UPI000DCF5A48|nr:tryptophan--tRNA ligase [Helicobacter sp. 15-1451]RAX58853.1 tryptophan--tRNA ligase [Helicobacter sp. 15-1451]
MSKKRIFSGIQPTGNIHLGNYLGAVKNWVNSQEQFENIFCIVNSHAITVKQDSKILKEKTYELMAMLLACGIDAEKSILFVQSQVNEHTALAWILDCYIPMGDMSRMTQFKDKSSQNAKNINVGLFNYPALMAADILLYDVDFVPVGDDQRQHIELTRDVAQRFNYEYGETFKIPESIIPDVGARIMSLSTPTKKMSKSDASPQGTIALLDSPKDILAKIKRATTDSLGHITFNTEQHGVYNLLKIYQALSLQTEEQIILEFEGKGYGVLKQRVSEVIIESLKPIQEHYFMLQKEPNYLEHLICKGADAARQIAESRYRIVKERVGLL